MISIIKLDTKKTFVQFSYYEKNTKVERKAIEQ